MIPTLAIDTRGFSAMCRDLAQLGQMPNTDRALDVSVNKVLQTAIDYTTAPKLVKFNKHSTSVRAGDSKLSINTGEKAVQGRVWLREHGTFYIIRDGAPNRHWSNERWGRAQRLLAQLEARHRGDKTKKRMKLPANIEELLVSQSWYQIAVALGYTVKVNPAARGATPSDGKVYTNGSGFRMASGFTRYIQIENAFPYHQDNVRRILQQAVNTRVRAFHMELSKGVFDDLKVRARRYPGIFVSA